MSLHNFILVPSLYNFFDNYTDVNKDTVLRKKSVKYFYNELIDWISNDKDFIELKNTEFDNLNNKNQVLKKIFKLLRYYIKKKKINWWELEKKYKSVKRYIRNNITNINI